MAKRISRNVQIGVIVFAVIVSIFLVQQGHPPEFYDRFGLGVFTFIAGLSIWMLTTKKETSDLNSLLLLALGISGLIVDGSVVLGGLR